MFEGIKALVRYARNRKALKMAYLQFRTDMQDFVALEMKKEEMPEDLYKARIKAAEDRVNESSTAYHKSVINVVGD